MLLSRRFVVATIVVTLAYLGESLFGPVAGRVANDFGRSAVDGFAFMSAALCGAAVSGFVIHAFVPERWLGRWLATALVMGSVLNLIALASGSWPAALVLRAAAGCCFGVTVSGTIILLAQSISGSKLAQGMSLLFSIVFLSTIPVMLFGPAVADQIGTTRFSAIHLVLCASAAVMLALDLPRNGVITASTRRLRLVEAVSRVFWSRGKALAFAVHAANLFAALLILVGLQPALSGRGLGETETGALLAVLSATTLIGGFAHASLVHRLGLWRARWALIVGELALLPVAAGCLLLGADHGTLLAALILTFKGLLGGPPTFEALLYDMGPRDAACSGLQRSLGMIVAIAGASGVLVLARGLDLDVLSAMFVALAAASAMQVVAFLLLSRDTAAAPAPA